MRFTRTHIIPFVGLLSVLLLLSSCDKTDTPDTDTNTDTGANTATVTDAATVPESVVPSDTDADTTADTEPTSTKIKYKVTVRDSSGNPMTDIIVKAQKNGIDAGLQVIGPTGVATFSLEPGAYTVLLTTPSGTRVFYDSNLAVLTETATELTLTAWRDAAETISIYAPFKNDTPPDPNDLFAEDRKNFNAAVIGEGESYVELLASEYVYIVFAPTRAGVYEFTCSEGVHFSFHGMPLNVLVGEQLPTDGKITIPVEEGSIGSDSISLLTFRLSPDAGTTTAHALFTAKWTGEIQRTPEELAEWITVQPDRELKPYEGDTSGRLTDVKILDVDTLPTVVKGEDGYYHLNTVDGPIVFLRIKSKSPYVESFATMCETDVLRAYFYDENGTFLYKEGYNVLVNAYAEVANDDGVVPLNDQLIHFVQNAGRYMGWWDHSNRYIFGDKEVDTTIAWMFACAYYA